MTQPKIAVRIDMVGDERVKTDLRGIGSAGETAFAQLERATGGASRGVGNFNQATRNAVFQSRSTSLAIQNASFQIGDFATQVGSGTSATRALAQQLPQLLGGFGAYGAVVGAVVAGLGAYLVQSREGADATASLADATSDATDALKAYRDAVREANESSETLFDTYGRNVEVAREFLELERGLARVRAEQAQRQVRETLADTFGNVRFGRAERVPVDQFGEERRDLLLRRQRRQLREVEKQLELGTAAALEFNRALNVLDSEAPFDEQVEATRALVDLIQQSSAETGGLSDEMEEFYEALLQSAREGISLQAIMEQAAGSTEKAASAAVALGNNLAAAASQIQAIKGAIDSLSLNNIGLEAQNRALAAGGNALDARAEGMLAQRRAELGDALGSGDAIIRAAAQKELEEYEAAVRRNVAAQTANAALMDSLRASGSSGGSSGGGGRKEEVEVIEEIATGWALVSERLTEYAASAQDYGTQVSEAFIGAFGAAETAVSRFAQGGKLEIADMVRSIIGDIARIATQRFITGPIAAALGGAFAGGGIGAAVMHSGGLVGAGGVGRAVSPLAFFGAPRMHSGGMVGLRPDERPIIAQTGERVLSRREARGYGQPMQVTVNIATRDAESFRRSQTQVAADLSRALGRAQRGM